MPISNFNPLLYDANISVNGTTQQVDILPGCLSVRLYPVTGNSTIYLNSTNNTPGMLLYEAAEIQNLDGQIEKIFIYSSGSTVTNVKMVKNPGVEIIRAGIEA